MINPFESIPERLHNCPNCGGTLQDDGKCRFCGSVVYDFLGVDMDNRTPTYIRMKHNGKIVHFKAMFDSINIKMSSDSPTLYMDNTPWRIRMSKNKVKLIIEIDKEVYEHVRDKKFFISPWVDDAIAQGTLITDGDVEKAVEILRNYHNGYFGYKIDDVKKAHDLAIAALATSSTRQKGKQVEDSNIITLCRKTAVEQNLPLYFVYYEETGILDIYMTKTNELFEKRRCTKYLSNAAFKEIVDYYLCQYPVWKGCVE